MVPSLSDFFLFLLLMMRCLGLFLTAPVFQSRLIPPQVKIGFAAFLALLCLPLVRERAPVFSAFSFPYLVALFREVFLGVTFGIVTNLVFSSMQIVGEIVDFQMGFSYVNVVDPLSGIGVSVMGQFYLLLATMYYLGIGGYRLTIEGLVRSFALVPPGGFFVRTDLAPSFVRLVGEVMLLALRFGAPVIVALFLANFTLAVLSRAIPQMNVFIVGLPLNVGIGFFITLSTLPYLLPLLENVLDFLMRSFFHLLRGS